MENEEIKDRAREWFNEQDISAECPREGCKAVNKWVMSEPAKVNMVESTPQGARRITEVDHYVVRLECGYCGQAVKYYEEEQPA